MSWYWYILLPLILAMNIVAYILMAVDKKRASKGQWRVPEKTLFLVTGLFGGLGGTLAMFHLRHKTKHWYFRIFFPVMLALQIIILVLLWIFVK